MENKEIVYFKHFWEHILYKQMLEIEQRYFGKVSLATDLYDELRVKFEGEKCNCVCRLFCGDGMFS